MLREWIKQCRRSLQGMLIPMYCRVPHVGNTDNIQTAAAGQTGRTPKTITKLTISDLSLTTFKCSSIALQYKFYQYIYVYRIFFKKFNIKITMNQTVILIFAIYCTNPLVYCAIFSKGK